MSKKITVFTTNTCGYCAMVKKYLDGKGIAYSVVNLDEQPEKQAEVYAKLLLKAYLRIELVKGLLRQAFVV